MGFGRRESVNVGSDALAQYRVKEAFGGGKGRGRGHALLEVRLVTGRRNQIRLQAHLRGHPLVGETKYVDDPAAAAAAAARVRAAAAEAEAAAVAGPGASSPRGGGVGGVGIGRCALHAWRLGVRHPISGRVMQFEAPLPDDMAGLVGRLREREGAPRGAGREGADGARGGKKRSKNKRQQGAPASKERAGATPKRQSPRIGAL